MQTEDINAILNEILSLYKPDNILVINIGGASRSGKSRLATDLKQLLKINSVIVCLDNYIKSVHERNARDDFRFKYKYDEMQKVVHDLKHGNVVEIPTYYHHSRSVDHTKKEKHQLKEGVIIVEGVCALDNKGLREIADINIFVDIPDHIRIMRSINTYINVKKVPLEKTIPILASREDDEIVIIKESAKYAQIIFNSK